MILYNKTKGGVDAFDQITDTSSTNRKTRRWPLCVFYGILNAAAVNTFVIWKHKCKERGETPTERRIMLQDLAMSLVHPWAERRLTQPTIQRKTALVLREVFKMSIPPTPREAGEKKKRRCYFCPRSKDTKVKSTCASCSVAICGSHSNLLCKDCK